MGRPIAPMAMFLFVLLLGGCDPVPVQYPPGSPSYPSPYPTTPTPSQPATLPPPGTQPQPQVSGAQRSQYVWDKMMEGVAMGGSIAGPYGAGAGLVGGFLFGLFTADSHYAQLNAKIQSEQLKDKELEAQIEREMERQRELEAQLGKTGNPPEPKQREEPQPAQRPIKETKAETRADKKDDLGSLASLGKKEISPAPSSSPFKNVEIRDTNQDGIPDLWIYYNPIKPGEIVRQEEDTNGDGRVDTWSTFKEEKLVRREVDTKGNGRPDTIYYYEDGKISREERDENGDGRSSFRAVYQNGRLAKVEKDLDRDGKIDLWIYYDTTKEEETVLKEERDLNADGIVDLWSYYERGRLVQRDVSTLGLDYLLKQEGHPQFNLPHDPPTPKG